MRLSCAAIIIVGTIGIVGAQPREVGGIESDGTRSVLAIEAPRPLDLAARVLASRYGMRVSVEDPAYRCSEDLSDITDSVAPGKLSRPLLVPRGGALRVPFEGGADGRPADPAQLVADLVDAANEVLPYGYRLDRFDDLYVIVPTATRDEGCRTVAHTALLDRRVTIPVGVRSVAESAHLLAESLSAQSGMRVSCCQASVAGIPWGLEQVRFGATDERARDVLRRLIAATSGWGRDRSYWLLRCEGLSDGWCLINLEQAAPWTPQSD